MCLNSFSYTYTQIIESLGGNSGNDFHDRNTMPPKPTPEKAAKYKSHSVDKGKRNEQVQEEIAQLPDDLKKLWSEREFHQFCVEALAKLDSDFEKWKKLSESLQVILPTLAYSYDIKVHRLVQVFYSTYTHEDVGSFTESMYEYVTNVMGTGRSKLVPSDCIKEVFPYHKRIMKEVRDSRAKELTCVRTNLFDFPENNSESADIKMAILTTSTLKVESTLASKCRETPAPREGSILLNIAVEFVDRSISKLWFKLDSNFPKRPGVYFLYYIADQELYKDTQLVGSCYRPVYVGMSTSSISERLANHRDKIAQAKDLNVADFAVHVMFVDNKHYAPCIEGMLIEHFNPIWNKETVGLCFGVGDNSLWKQIHVDQNVDKINELEGLLQIGESSDCESSSSSDKDEDQ